MSTRRFLLSGILAILVFSNAACSNPASSPLFTGPSDESPSTDVAAPSVDDVLARESGRERIVYHVGPVDLPAGTKAEAMLDRPLSMRFQTDKPIWVTGFVPKVVNSNGGELPTELLHHAIVFNMHEENALCAGTPNPFLVAGSMMTEVELPQGFGYPVLPTDPIEAKVVLENPTETDYADVFFEFTLVTKPMSDLAEVKDVKPVLVELEPCTHAAMQVEPRAFVKKNAAYQVPVTGSLVAANGILQNFGSALELTARDELIPFWRAEGVQDENRRVVALTDNPFMDPEGPGFKAGDKIVFSASYDNSSDGWLDGASAAAMVYLAPND